MIIMGIIAFLYFFGCICMAGKKKKKLGAYRVITGLLFAFYISQVVGITLLNRNAAAEARIDLNILEVYKIAFGGNSVFLTQIIGNVLMFIPLGILVPMCFKSTKGAMKMLVLAFACSLAIETTQLYTHTGLFELMDLIHNTLGGMLGFGIYMLGYKVGQLFHKGKKR
jgi:glycopeptide antibiotics resistance protein